MALHSDADVRSNSCFVLLSVAVICESYKHGINDASIAGVHQQGGVQDSSSSSNYQIKP
jgi:hypothetical protein